MKKIILVFKLCLLSCSPAAVPTAAVATGSLMVSSCNNVQSAESGIFTAEQAACMTAYLRQLVHVKPCRANATGKEQARQVRFGFWEIVKTD